MPVTRSSQIPWEYHVLRQLIRIKRRATIDITMAATLADVLFYGACTTRGLLAAPAAPAAPTVTVAPAAASLTQELEARIQVARDEILEYHCTHRPPNTARSYAPKQKEWRAWCAAQSFPASSKYLPGDWVDKGKLLLFIKEEVALRAPRRGRWLDEEKERKRTAVAEAGVGAVAVVKEERPRKRQKRATGVAVAAAVVQASNHLIVEGEDDEDCSELVLMYNTVRSYILAIKELWSY